jgi:hypothetical protein
MASSTAPLPLKQKSSHNLIGKMKTENVAEKV